MFVRIYDDTGSVLIDGEYGNIVVISGDWKDGETPTHFNVGEYRSFYGVQLLPAELALGDIGYTREDGVSVPPAAGFRKALVSSER